MGSLKRLEKILNQFIERDIWLAVAESCTGGYVCHMITNIPGASKTFERGVICYSNQAKTEILKVDSKSMEEHGAVSETVGYQLAKNIRELSKVDLGIGITGIAGPTGGTPEKPVGLVYIGYSTVEKTSVEKHVIKTDRIEFKNRVLENIIIRLEQYIGKGYEL